MEQYPVVDVAAWQLAGFEPDGLSPNTWYREPVTGDLWLFKPVVSHGERRQGEDWSEKVSSEIGALLGVPTSKVELATLRGYPGCISLNLCPREWEMQQGAVLLAGIVAGYRSKIKGRAGHTLANIRQALVGLTTPPGTQFPSGFGAFDVFAGYVMFDALIGNRDRHDGNWSVLRPPPGSAGSDALCGSYDHASSLGFNLTDEERVRRVADQSVMAWAERGTAYKFEHEPGTRPPTLVSHAAAALSMASPGVRDYWLDRLVELRTDSVEEVVASIGVMSEPAAAFALQLVAINKGRLLNER